MTTQPPDDAEVEPETRGAHDRLREIVDAINERRQHAVPVPVDWAAQLLDAVDRYIITGELPDAP